MIFNRKKSALNDIYTTHAIDGFAFSMIGIFIPVYLLTLGYDLVHVFLFFIYYNISLAGSSVFVGYFTSQYGYKKTLLLRYPFLFAYLVLLYNLNSAPGLFVIVAVLGGLQSALYWTPLNILFAKNSKPKKMGSSVGKLFALPQLSGLIGPIIGGYITIAFGFKPLFVLTFLIFIVSTIPLLKSTQIKSDLNFKFLKGVKFFKKHPKFLLTEIFDNVAGEAEGVIWPIFIYLSMLNIFAVGLIGSFITTGTIIFTLLVGRLTDRYNKKIFIRIGAFIVLLNWLIRYFSNSEVVYFASTLLAGFSLSLLLVPYTSMVFNQAKKDAVDEFFVIKELPSVVGRVLIFVVAILFVSNIKLVFPLAGLAYLIFLIL